MKPEVLTETAVRDVVAPLDAKAFTKAVRRMNRESDMLRVWLRTALLEENRH